MQASILGLVPVLAVAIGFAGEARADDAAGNLLKEASALDKAGKTDEAHAKLVEAWKLGHRYDVAAALGMNEKKSGDFAHAAQHLEYAIRFFPDSVKQDARQPVIDAFTDVRSKVAAIRLRVLPDASSVKIDGEMPELLGIDYDVFVMPGSRNIELPNHAAQAIDAKAEGSYTITAEDPPAPKAAVPDAPVTAQPKAASSRSPIPIVIMGTLAAGGAGLGIGMTVLAKTKSDDAKTIASSPACTTVDASGAPSAACVAEGSRAVADHNTFQAVGIAGFVGCGVALTGTLMYALWPSSHAKVEAAYDPTTRSGFASVGARF
jgi:hypothetical protein